MARSATILAIGIAAMAALPAQAKVKDMPLKPLDRFEPALDSPGRPVASY